MTEFTDNPVLLHFVLSAVASAGITEIVKLGRGDTSKLALRLTALASGVGFALLLDRSLFNLVLGVCAGGLSTYIYWAVKRFIRNHLDRKDTPESPQDGEP